MANPKGGKLGSVNGHSTVRNWSVNIVSATKKFGASNTKGGSGARRGAMDWTGSFAGYGGAPLVLPGESFTFDGSTGVDNTEANSYSGPAIVDSVAITWNYAAQDILSYVVNFSGDGELVAASDAGGDVAAITAPVICGTEIHLDAKLPDVEQCVLTITAANKPYVNSDTIFNGKCWTKRRPGPIDWTAAITQQNADGVADPAIQEDYLCKFYTYKDAGGLSDTWWELAWGQLEQSTGITTNIETGDIVKRTLNVTMNANKETDSVIGRIVLPDETLWWGTAAA